MMLLRTLISPLLLGLPLLVFPLWASAGPAPDNDNDTVPDVLDNCSALPNAGVLACDTDMDGYGNVCDGDFDQSNTVNATDFGVHFLPAFSPPGAPTPSGTDMDCSGTVNATDFGTYFLPQFNPPAGVPGPSGLACAGTVPCK